MATSDNVAVAAADLVSRPLAEKVHHLRSMIQDYESLVVAYSGGVDSAYLMSVAHDVLGGRAIAVTAKSPSLPASELTDATALANRLEWQHRVIETQEVLDPRYAANDVRRCYFCKTSLYSRLEELFPSSEWAAIANGTNVDDLGDYRPGLEAASERRVRSPMVHAGLTKTDIRTLSRADGLPIWDKPAQACLSSRIPYGTPVTIETLSQIEAAEAALRDLGLRQLRVRHNGRTARIEVPEEDIVAIVVPEMREAIVSRLREVGYTYVTLDLAGYRSGSLNEGIAGVKGSNGTV
ncbi:MAG: ATP-dependent sacrificial sulfur transferase LarE [Chloroflexi bacterium]|nr:ATP-dependent sacrificial sulfur transferase LarE [Chloroflexota bacterium]